MDPTRATEEVRRCADAPLTRRALRTRRKRRGKIITRVFISLSVLLAALAGAFAYFSPSSSGREMPERLAIGISHTQFTADTWKPGAASARNVIADAVDIQNQPIMGWGALNPEPAPGQYDFRSLDARVSMMQSVPHTVLSITLCCAPDWMKGGSSGATDWSRLEQAPAREHYGDFARLAARVAQRYPEVEYFLVWNELKGFYNPAANNWDIAAFTALYDAVYRAVKEVRPDAKIGGPYVPMDLWSSRDVMSNPSDLAGPWGVVDGRAIEALQYWLENKAGADFLVVDGNSGTRDKGVLAHDLRSAAVFADVTRWLRSETELPVWWAELYALPTDQTLPSDSPHRAELFLSAVAGAARAGAQAILLWQPEAHPGVDSAALWSNSEDSAGGRPLPLARQLAWVRRYLDQDGQMAVEPVGAGVRVSVSGHWMLLEPDGSMTTDPTSP
jgi:hypothetical protein